METNSAGVYWVSTMRFVRVSFVKNRICAWSILRNRCSRARGECVDPRGEETDEGDGIWGIVRLCHIAARQISRLTRDRPMGWR